MENLTNEELVLLAQKGDGGALNLILERNEKLIHDVAKRFKPQSDPLYEDLIQEGRIAMANAVKHYKPGNMFSTYAWVAIYRGIDYAVRRDKKFTNDVSLDKPINDRNSIVDILPDKQSSPLLLILIKQALETLTEREKEVIIQHYFYKKTLATISREINTSRSNCSRIHTSALKKIRNFLS